MHLDVRSVLPLTLTGACAAFCAIFTEITHTTARRLVRAMMNTSPFHAVSNYTIIEEHCAIRSFCQLRGQYNSTQLINNQRFCVACAFIIAQILSLPSRCPPRPDRENKTLPCGVVIKTGVKQVCS